MSVPEIEGRIARLERRARRDRAFALGVLAIALATAQAPSAPPVARPLVIEGADHGSARLNASGIVVRDPAGKIRTDAGIDADGSPGADLYDTTGELREAVYLLADKPLLRLFDATGKRRAEMFLSSDLQNPEFVFRDNAGTMRLGLFEGAQNEPEFDLNGSDGKTRAYLEAEDAAPFLVMRDNAAATRLVLGGYTSGKIGGDIRDASENVLWSKP